MKNSIWRLPLGSLVALVVLAACSKQSDNTALTKENLAGTYLLSSIKVKTAGIPETDVTYNVLDSCEVDDLYKLNPDLTFEYIDAGVACNPDGSYSGNWSITGNILVLDGDTATVSMYDGKNLALTHSETDSLGIKYDFTASLVKQ